MSEKISVGIVGSGFAGGLHEDALRRVLGSALVGVVEVDRDKRDQAKARLGEDKEVYDDIGDLLEARPDLIVLAVPPHENPELVSRIANAESRPKAVLIEKPPANNSTETDKMDRNLKEVGIMGMVALVGLFHPEFKKAYSWIEQGLIGEIVNISEQIHWGGSEMPLGYVQGEAEGVVLENGIHTFQHFCEYMKIKPEEWDVVSARIGNPFWGENGSDFGKVVLENGRVMADASWTWPKDYAIGQKGYVSTIVGKKGQIDVFGFEGAKLTGVSGKEEVSVYDSKMDVAGRHVSGFVAMHQALNEAINNNGEPPVSISYATELLRLYEQIVAVSGWKRGGKIGG